MCAGTRIRTWVAVKATVLQTVAIVRSAIPANTLIISELPSLDNDIIIL